MTDPTSEKVCSRCRKTFDLTSFNRERAAKDGLQRYCRECTRERGKARRAANPDATREYNARYRIEHRDIADAATTAWRENNRERVADLNRRWAAAHPGRGAAWRASHSEHRAAVLAAWKAANPERVRGYQRKRRAAGYGGNPSDLDTDGLWLKCGGNCGLCHEPIDAALAWPDPGSRSIDHILPLSMGGLHDQGNAQWAHLVCNMRKGNRLSENPALVAG